MSSKQKKKQGMHSLEEVVHRELGYELDKAQQRADWGGGDLTPEMLRYAAKDSRVLLPLTESLGKRIDEAGLERAMQIEHRALPAMVWMASAGASFDAEGWQSRITELEEEARQLEGRLAELGPAHPENKAWNWNSWQQVLRAFELLGVELPDTKEETLTRCDNPLARTLLEYRRTSKLTSTYGPSLLGEVEDGRIYASWFQMGAQTGRMSCSKPNLQNLPPEVRHYVRAPEGKVLVKADYSQIELRVAARISGDERMLAAYEAGEDLHTLTAKNITGKDEISTEDRRLAKAVNFGLLYGQGAAGLKDYARTSYGVEMSVEEAATYRRKFFETYTGIRAWQERERRQWQRGNRGTRTLSGRRRTGLQKYTERLNSPVQGTGADGLKLALALLWERRGECPEALPVLTVHDDIVIECDEEHAGDAARWLERAMVDGMEDLLNAPDLEGPHVPVEVDTKVGKRWVN